MPCENLSCYIIPMLHEANRTLRSASMETMDGNRGIDDASFLADLDGFLHDCDVLHPSTDLHPATTDLLQDSNQLVAETEALLASYATKTTHVHVQQDHTRTSTVKTTKTPEELQDQLSKNTKVLQWRLAIPILSCEMNALMLLTSHRGERL
ncbi:hypothetical protein GQ600_20661 [Phytophthora cactorum]|nr:hypothetical protein GQ600_20661 [Phytophthora cactorum]